MSYTTKRVHQKNGYFTEVYDTEGKYLGKGKYHGSNNRVKYAVLERIGNREAKTVLTKDALREKGLAIPQKIVKSPHDYTFPFEYEIKLWIEEKHQDKYVTVCSRKALTRAELKEELKALDQDHVGYLTALGIDITKFKIRKLMINSGVTL